jgi:outer membrane receptor protein involved in Fe transport
MKYFKKVLHSLWAIPLSMGVGTAAQAQAPAPDDAVALEEIVVTARKREENLLVVPIAITAVTAAQLERQGVKDVTGLIDRDPSLSFDTGLVPYDTRIVIRGLSPTRGRPNVATLVDGVDVSSESIGVAGGSLLISPRLLDIAQVEIVKGPQSALFGRSAFAGAISYTTQDPSSEPTRSVSMDLSSEGQYEVKGSMSAPLSDTLGYRLGVYAFTDDGFYFNRVTQQSTGGGEGRGVALSLKWEPSENYSAKFRSEFTNDEFDPSSQAALAFNSRNAVPANASICNVGTNAAGGLAPVGFIIDSTCAAVQTGAPGPAPTGLIANQFALGLNAFRDLERLTGNRGVFDDMTIPSFVGSIGDAKGLQPSFNRNSTRAVAGSTAPDFPGSDRSVRRISLVQNFDTAIGRFSSLTGYTNSDVDVLFDIDKTSFLPIQQTLETYTSTRQFSQEIRFTSDFEGSVNFFAGLQYWTESVDQRERNITVIGEGTLCFAFDPPNPTVGPGLSVGTTTIQTPPQTVSLGPPPFSPTLTIPPGSCTSPTGGFTSVDVSPYMASVWGAREPTLTTRDIDHKSFYLDVEWDITDTLRLIGEARWVEEVNDVSSGFTDGSNGPGTIVLCGSNGPCRDGAGVPSPGFPPVVPARGFNPPDVTRQIAYPTLKEEYVTPKGTLQWTPSDDLNVYASYAMARKPGGYSTVTLSGTGAPASGDDVFFAAEKLKVYEIGAKWRSPTGNVRVEAAAFRTDFTDKQVGTQILVGNTISNRVTNAGKALLEGVELGMQWRPGEHWLVAAGLTYFSTYKYTNYKTTSTGAGEIARVGNCVVGYLDGATFVPLANNTVPFNPGSTTTTRSLTCQLDRTGKFIEDTPELAMAMSVGYRRPMGDSGMDLIIDFDANWEGERYVEDDNKQWLDSYWLANLRVGVDSEKWSAVVFVDNVADDRTIRSAGSGPAIYASDFRFGFFNYFPPGAPAPAQRLVPAPSIPTTVFANLPSPRVIGLRMAYKF